MGFATEWLETAKSVTISPSETLRNEQRTDGFDYPVKFMLVSISIAAVLNTIGLSLSAMMNPMISLTPVSAATYFAGVMLGGPVVLAVLAAIIHVFAYLLGAKQGYSRTFAAVCYGTAVAPLAAVFTILSAFVPLAGLGSALIGLWALQIEYRGVQHFHGISSFRAGMSIILPILLTVVVSVGATVMYMAPLLFG